MVLLSHIKIVNIIPTVYQILRQGQFKVTVQTASPDVGPTSADIDDSLSDADRDIDYSEEKICLCSIEVRKHFSCSIHSSR